MADRPLLKGLFGDNTRVVRDAASPPPLLGGWPLTELPGDDLREPVEDHVATIPGAPERTLRGGSVAGCARRMARGYIHALLADGV